MVSPLEQAIDFLKELGFFDVVLPFLLIFTLIFAILEKTRIFGEVEVEGRKYAKKNINAMIAFVIALLFVASKELVNIVNVSLPMVVLILILLLSFMMLFGFLIKEGWGGFERGVWQGILSISGFAGIVLIFLYAMKWWPFSGGAFSSGWVTGPVFISIILISAIIATILFITIPWGPPRKKEDEKGG